MTSFRALALLAWKESQGSRARLLMFSASTIFGIAALVAISSFAHNLQSAVELQARALLGADLLLRTSAQPSNDPEGVLSKIPGERADEIGFSNMAVFPKSGESRLVQVRALQKGFPFYGEIKSTPPDAAERYQADKTALIDRALSVQFDLEIGDTIRIGSLEVKVGGLIERVSGDSPMWETIAPRVYIPFELAAQTDLIKRGSRVSYKSYFRLPEGVSADELVARYAKQISDERMRADTVQERKKSVRRISDNVTSMLKLSSFFALLLGALGVASGAHVYAARKIPLAAILRTLGARSSDAGRVYFIQMFSASLAATIAGAAAGVVLHFALPSLLSGVVPIDSPVFVSWRSVAIGIAFGLLVSVAAIMNALIGLHGVSPLLVLRGGEPDARGGRNRSPKRLLLLSVSTAIALLCILQANTWWHGLLFFGGILLSAAVVAIVSRLVMKLAGATVARISSYTVRQGFLNLSRPNNQTLLLIGVSAAAVCFTGTMIMLRGMILQQIRVSVGENQPNMILFDIQLDQRNDVEAFLAERRVPRMDVEPVVTMRLTSVNGRSIRELLDDEKTAIPEWTLRREYRSTYRNVLRGTETVLSGEFPPRPAVEGEPVPVSLEKGIAENLGVTVGAKLAFDVQGVDIEAVVGSIRDVDWQQVRPNFFVVFPEGVLEGAPQFFVFTTRAANDRESADIQRAVVGRFPNVSILDASSILKVVDDILSKFAVVAELVTVCIILIALLLLVTAASNSASARSRENALLKVLGARRIQVLAVTGAEYLSLGVIGALVGNLLAGLFSFALAKFVFKVSFLFIVPVSLSVVAASAALICLVGSVSSVRTFRSKPLTVLRAE